METFQAILIGIFVNLITPFLLKKTKFQIKKSEGQKISNRLQLGLKLINESRDEKFTVAKLSRILNLEKVSDLEKYFLDKEEPSFEFLEKYANEFGLSSRWLIEGKGNPFKHDEEIYIDVFDCLEKINELNPSIIYFIRANNISGETCIAIEVNEHCHVVLNTTVHFSKQNGHGGTRQLVSFRKLIMSLILEKNYITKGIIVSGVVFNALFQGKIHPMTAIDKRLGPFQHWHDDFTDLYNERYGYKYHEEYDQNFKDAFHLVKSFVAKHEES
ncbi:MULTISPECIES: hypothetical protein [Acinetobacter]|uniref:hypothetical protein n=1 Tax=Acinetobacter TaxID=469 RepID=UPI000C25061F|nr:MULTISPECIES: hypothetical protein [Acinetobacter]PJI29702.1 hypothetical protein CU478_08310 [Acinetobacter pseudolwoffii]